MAMVETNRSPRQRPLSGIRVLDLSRVLAGPYCSLLLADMGAEVVKIENPNGGDDSRGYTVPSVDGESIYFLTVNRNKRSVALDLKSPAGKAAFLKLVDNADVVLENFRTGVMERLGLGYAVLAARRPSLIYCAISGYGRDGPNTNLPGYDPVAQGESGLMSMTGEPDGAAMRTGPSLVDMATGMYAAQAISAALLPAVLQQQGRMIEVSLFESGLNMLLNFAGSHLITGSEPTRAGNNNQVLQPAGVYQAADGPFMLSVGSTAQWTRLCRDVVDRPDLLQDKRFVDVVNRVANGLALRAELGKVFAGADREAWVRRLRAANVPAGIVATVSEALNSELVTARGSIRPVTHATLGHYPAVMTPARLHQTDPVCDRGAPLLGEHTREILRDMAGMDDQTIDDLIASRSAIEAN